MVDRVRTRIVTSNGGTQCALAEIGVDPASGGATDDLTVEQILDKDQIRPAFIRSDVYNICHPNPVGSVCIKILMEQIGGHGVIVPGIHDRFEFIVAYGVQPMFPLDVVKPVAATMWKL